jgi:flagellar biosynthetic protein FlhB
MPEEDKHSRTEKPTAKRKKEARREGQVARSPELVTWITLLVGSYLVQLTASSVDTLWLRMTSQWSSVISHPSPNADFAYATMAASGALTAAAPVLLGTVVLALVANLAQTRGLITTKPLKPDFKRLNPVTGIKRMVNPRSAWELAKQLIRVGLLSIIGWRSVQGLIPVLVDNGPLSSPAVAGTVLQRVLSLVRTIAAISLALAAVDYGIQFRRIAKQLRMTKHEVKEEQKSNDGNPVIKGAIRRRQRQLSRSRMVAAVASADAVVLNPTHLAVAIKYERGKGAPRVVAKGADELAAIIREEARAHQVPMVQDVGLARALYAACQLEQEIPTELYEAVARLLTLIFSLRATGRLSRIDGQPHTPPAPLLARS